MDNAVLHGSCTELLKTLPDESVSLIVTDPPFNIGLAYDLYEDRRDYNAYCKWMDEWIGECKRVLAPNGSIYIWQGDEYAAETNIALKRAGLFFRNWIIWYYTFGENQRKKFNRCHTHCLYFTKSKDEFVFNADAIKVPSQRQLKYNDKRAKAGGKLPDDCWEAAERAEASPSGLPEFEVAEDVWKVSRLCGTFAERVKKPDGSAHPCQMPESVIRRCILASSNSGELVVDPFCGTGTTAAVAAKEGRRYWTCDLSEEYVNVARARLDSLAKDG